MSEPEKKGSPWPWVVVPVAAFTLFFVLRSCRQSLPPADHAPAASVSAPAADIPAAEAIAAEPSAAPASTPAPQ